MAKKINLGKVGITTEGNYDPSKAYEKLCCVLHNGVSWVSTTDVPAGNAPDEGSAFWQKMASRGEQGPQGPVGPQGNSAFDGNGVEIVNNLTQGGEAAVLSAEQGKILKNEVTELSEQIDIKNDKDRFLIVDSNGNILAKFDNNGLSIHDINILYNEKLQSIKEIIDALFGIVSPFNERNNQLVVCDNDENVAFRLDSDGLKLRRLNICNENGEIVNVIDDRMKVRLNYQLQSPPFVNYIQTAGMARLFNSWGIVGASFECGVQDFKENGVSNSYSDILNSWPEMFAELNHTTMYNYAMGGRTMKAWCIGVDDEGTTTLGLRDWQALQKAEFVPHAWIINLSSNDFTKSKFNGEIGSANDIDVANYNNNADTLAGWLGGVIQRIKSLQPRAYFFVCSCRKGAGNADAAEMVRQVCDTLDNCFFLDMYAYGIDWTKKEIKDTLISGYHPTILGHKMLCDQFNTYIDFVIKSNAIAFRDASFVGTNRYSY